MSRVEVRKSGNVFRLFEVGTKRLAKRDGKPVDGGGFFDERRAKLKARGVNAAVTRRENQRF